MHAGVLTQVDVLGHGKCQRAYGVEQDVTRQGEHRAVVVRVDVEVEQRGAARRVQRVEHDAVASFGHVRHALEHRCRVRRGRRSTPVECRRCTSDWHSRSTTTRSPGSHRCAGRASSSTRRPPTAPATTPCGCRTTSSSTSPSTAARPIVTACSTPSSPSAALAGVVHAPAPRHAGVVRGVATGRGAREVARHPRPHLRGPPRRRHRRRMVRTGVRGDRSGDAVAGRATGAAARGDRGAARSARWGTVHRRRALPPRVRRAQRPAVGPATGAADPRGGQGRPPARAGRGARRRVEHMLGVDARRVPRAPRHARARVRRGRAATRRRCSGRSACTRCVARTSATSSGASAGSRRRHRPACSTAPPSTSGARAAWWAPSSRSASRRRDGTTLGVETLIVGVGAVPFAVTAVDDVELLAEALRR